MSRRVVVMASALAVVLASCRGEESRMSSKEAEIAALTKTDEEWKEVIKTKNVDKIVAYWTDDAIIYAPGQPPIVGKDAIRKYVVSSFEIPGFSITWTASKVVVSESGDMAWTTGDNAVTMTDPAGKTVTHRGRFVTVWRKEQPGGWRCVVDVWNDPPAS